MSPAERVELLELAGTLVSDEAALVEPSVALVSDELSKALVSGEVVVEPHGAPVSGEAVKLDEAWP